MKKRFQITIDDIYKFEKRILISGGIQNSVASIVEKEIKTNDYITEIMKKTSTNIINTLGMASYSIRSASVEKEEELKNIMKSLVEKFNKKYDGLAVAEDATGIGAEGKYLLSVETRAKTQG